MLGPVLLNNYVRSLYATATRFADDHQIYKSFHHKQEYSIMVNELPNCFQAINA